MELPERITYWRQRAGLTKAQLAAACGITDVAVIQWESGATSPKSGRLKAIAAACGVDLRMFFSDPAPDRSAAR